MKRLVILTMIMLLVPMLASAQIRMCIPYWDFDACEVSPDNPGEPPAWCGFVNRINGVIGGLNDLLAPLSSWAE